MGGKLQKLTEGAKRIREGLIRGVLGVGAVMRKA